MQTNIGRALLAILVLLAVLYEKPVETKVKVRPLIRIDRVHTVRHGEHIFSIADKYFPQQEGTKDYARFVFAIKHENGMLEGRTLKPNDEIIIPMMIEVK